MSWIDTNRIKIENDTKEILQKDQLENFKLNIFKQFQVDLKSEIKTQFYYLKYTNLQPSEIRQFDYWEWQLMVEEMKEYMEKEKEEQEKSEKGQSYKNTPEYKQASDSMRQYGVNPSSPGSSFRTPNFSSTPNSSGFKMPKI
jgi:hypothetical protein